MRILYLDLDSLRADHLGCYGYHRNTSPNIDRIAADAIRFNNYYCSDAPCLPSRSALMTGRFGIHTGVVDHSGAASEPRPEGDSRPGCSRCGHDNLVAFLQRTCGFKTTASVSPFPARHGAWWFNAGFTEMHNTGCFGMESAEQITPVALKWITDNAAGDNWFLHINYWDPHCWYRAPESFGNPFEDEPIPDWITDEVLEKHLKRVGNHSASDLRWYDDAPVPGYPRQLTSIKNRNDLKRHFDGYDCGIAYMDQHLGMIFNALEAQNVLDDTVIIISADHGENQGELGIYMEHGTADNITCRIPMIIRWPGQTAGHVDNGLHYNLDLAPTLADMLGYKPAASWDGQSFAPAIRRGADCGRLSLVLSQLCHVCQRSVRFGDWLYIRTYHDGYWLFPREMLFNVVEDPHEQHDLSETRPDICQLAAATLLNWHDDMMKTQLDGHETDPLWTVIRQGGPCCARGYLKDYCVRLESTGRGWAVNELRQRHPREFK
jgi:arylsulfatase A-like enzyme